MSGIRCVFIPPLLPGLRSIAPIETYRLISLNSVIVHKTRLSIRYMSVLVRLR